MAKKGRDGTKSAAIQEYLRANKTANPKQIVEALHQKGVEVSEGLAKAVKYGKGKKKSSAKKAKRTAAVTSEPAVSSSELIRQYIAKNPKEKPREIEAGLKAEGVKVKLGLINSVKYSKVKKGGNKRRSRSPVVHAAARAIPASTLSIDQLIEVKKFADSVGGAAQVRKALDTLAELQ